MVVVVVALLDSLHFVCVRSISFACGLIDSGAREEEREGGERVVEVGKRGDGEKTAATNSLSEILYSSLSLFLFRFSSEL